MREPTDKEIVAAAKALVAKNWPVFILRQVWEGIGPHGRWKAMEAAYAALRAAQDAMGKP